MSLEVDVNFDLKKIYEDKMKRAEVALEKGIQEAATEIAQRTLAGENVDGFTFNPYSAGYAKYRSKVGRGTKVVLQLTGTMLKSIQTTIERGVGSLIGKIFITPTPGTKPPGRNPKKIPNAQEKAQFVQQVGNRKFFDLSDKQREKIVQRINEEMSK